MFIQECNIRVRKGAIAVPLSTPASKVLARLWARRLFVCPAWRQLTSSAMTSLRASTARLPEEIWLKQQSQVMLLQTWPQNVQYFFSLLVILATRKQWKNKPGRFFLPQRSFKTHALWRYDRTTPCIHGKPPILLSAVCIYPWGCVIFVPGKCP